MQTCIAVVSEVISVDLYLLFCVINHFTVHHGCINADPVFLCFTHYSGLIKSVFTGCP